jgi:hypothetical protein
VLVQAAVTMIAPRPLVVCALLVLRVLVVVFGAGSGRCGQGVKG